jgi:hypothetical protein
VAGTDVGRQAVDAGGFGSAVFAVVVHGWMLVGLILFRFGCGVTRLPFFGRFRC